MQARAHLGGGPRVRDKELADSLTLARQGERL